MSEEKHDLIIRRILVGLDASPHSISALEAACDLAARFSAELEGLFVEDIDLLRACELPFTREVRFFSGARRRLDTQQLERQLRAQASRARRSLTAHADRAHIRWSFRVTRGAIASELLEAAAETDLVILGKAGWSPIGRRRLGSTARTLLSEAPRLALILEEGTRLRPPVAVIYDGSPAAEKALVTAAGLARPREAPMMVLVLAEGPKAAKHVRSQAAEWLKNRGLLATYRSLTELDFPRLAQMLDSERAGTLVLPARRALLQDEALLALLDEIDIPVLLAR